MLLNTVSVGFLFALGAVAQGPIEPCTTTTTVRAKCCPAKSAYTATASVDCGGCSVLSTQTTGPVCDIFCPTATPVVSSTTTLAVCATSATSSACTITKTEQLPFGCVITEAASTATAFSNCGGCALTTSFTNRNGIGPVCVSGRKTVTDSSSTATVTSCFPEYSA